MASTSGRSSRSTFTLTKRSFITAAIVRVLERLVRHHVAPVARRVADRQEDRLVLGRARRERLLAPRVPVDRVVGVLAQVRAGLAGESVHTCRLRRARGGDGGRPVPTGSRACPTAIARSRRRAPARAAPCSRRLGAGCARRGSRASERRPARGWTTAATRSPQRSSGTPTTTASNTASCDFSADSTSSGYTFSPPVLIDTEPRPSTRDGAVVLDAGVVAGHRPPPPSITGNVAAVFSGSL